MDVSSNSFSNLWDGTCTYLIPLHWDFSLSIPWNSSNTYVNGEKLSKLWHIGTFAFSYQLSNEFNVVQKNNFYPVSTIHSQSQTSSADTVTVWWDFQQNQLCSSFSLSNVPCWWQPWLDVDAATQHPSKLFKLFFTSFLKSSHLWALDFQWATVEFPNVFCNSWVWVSSRRLLCFRLERCPAQARV